ncbi:glycosyltransferase [bacterium]|nr:glycosyltransferase [bacterium]
MNVLHLTAHLGGGVGKVMSGLAAQSAISGFGVQHRWVCFEKPERTFFIDKIRRVGCEVIIQPDSSSLVKLIDHADVVQLEWWNHPATLEALCALPERPMRLMVWSHVSGLYTPIFPSKLLEATHCFLFTSPCSYESREVAVMPGEVRKRFGVVSSSGGFEGFPEPVEGNKQTMVAGYVGSLNFSKLHPDYVDYLAAVGLPDFSVRMIGDPTNREVLTKQCSRLGRPELLNFRGYTDDIIPELSKINVLVYLMNPKHYGTAENALLEAMAIGVVPVVLDNPAERHIVEHQKTGLIVQSQKTFAKAIQWLHEYPEERVAMGRRAAQFVRARFSAEQTEIALHKHYISLRSSEKKSINFSRIFGDDPVDWFLACQREKAVFSKEGDICFKHGSMNYGLFEQSKGSVFHFSEYFPDNLKLKLWASKLKTLQVNMEKYQINQHLKKDKF